MLHTMMAQRCCRSCSVGIPPFHGKRTRFILSSVNPQYRAVLRTYERLCNLEIVGDALPILILLE